MGHKCVESAMQPCQGPLPGLTLHCLHLATFPRVGVGVLAISGSLRDVGLVNVVFLGAQHASALLLLCLCLGTELEISARLYFLNTQDPTWTLQTGRVLVFPESPGSAWAAWLAGGSD